MMMPTRPVDMAVGYFVFGGQPYANDLHLKIQGFPCQGMIAVYRYVIAFNAQDGNDASTGISCRMELHARFQFVYAVKTFPWTQPGSVHR